MFAAATLFDLPEYHQRNLGENHRTIQAWFEAQGIFYSSQVYYTIYTGEAESRNDKTPAITIGKSLKIKISQENQLAGSDFKIKIDIPKHFRRHIGLDRH